LRRTRGGDRRRGEVAVWRRRRRRAADFGLLVESKV
jgi:hypothetical protein